MASGVTIRRDLRSGVPHWRQHRTLSFDAPPLRRSRRANVVIIGAGISGAMMAQSLAAAGQRPLVLDRRSQPAQGSTAASTALLQYELDTPLVHLMKMLPPRKAQRIWRASQAAVNELRTRVHRLRIGARFETRPSLYLAGDVLDARGLHHEVKVRQRIGLPSELLERKALRHHFSLGRAAAILSHGNAEADPVELALGFLHRAVAQGARIHTQTEVVDIESGRSGHTLSTRDGSEILARSVVFCTGYELPKVVPSGANRIVSTWALATGPQPAHLWPQRALIWEASDPYLYARSTFDGRVICGGEDADISDAEERDRRTARKIVRIGRKLEQLLPHVDVAVESAWAGSFGSSPNGVPSIGEIPGRSRCYAVMGFGGNGITFSMLATELITSAVLGRKAADRNLFAFD